MKYYFKFTNFSVNFYLVMVKQIVFYLCNDVASVSNFKYLLRLSAKLIDTRRS
jgi:hypothetical protein